MKVGEEMGSVCVCMCVCVHVFVWLQGIVVCVFLLLSAVSEVGAAADRRLPVSCGVCTHVLYC